MLQVEHLHLKHVIQAVCVLEGVVLRSFGPDGGQVLFIRDTGQLMLSRSGIHILTALKIDHPLARTVVECVWRHSRATGDGSKTFVLLLASLLRGLQTTARETTIAGARRTAERLLAFGLEELVDVVRVGVIPHTDALSWGNHGGNHGDPEHSDGDDLTDDCPVLRLLETFFLTRLGRTHARCVSRLTRDLVSVGGGRATTHPSPLAVRFTEKHFAALHTPVCGFPAHCSRLLEGQVIHRDFAVRPRSPQSEQQPIKAVALVGAGGSLQPDLLSGGAVLQVGGPGPGPAAADTEGGVLKYSTWTERVLDAALGRLRGLGVSLVLSSGKQTEAALAAAGRAGIAVAECVDEEELSLFAELSGAQPASECGRVGAEHVALLAFCRPVVLGAHRYVHVAFPEPAVRPRSLVLCGTGEGQVEQCARAIPDALRMLLAMWLPWQPTAEDDNDAGGGGYGADTSSDRGPAPSRKDAFNSRCVLPAGGEFEFLLHRALIRHSRVCSPGGDDVVPALCRLLADALLSVPRHLYSHRPRHFLRAQRLCSGLRHDDGCDDGDGGGAGGEPQVSVAAGEQSRGGSSAAPDAGLESVLCKYQLVVAVLQCLRSLLRADAVLHVRRAPPARTSPEDTGVDDDDDDDDES